MTDEKGLNPTGMIRGQSFKVGNVGKFDSQAGRKIRLACQLSVWLCFIKYPHFPFLIFNLSHLWILLSLWPKICLSLFHPKKSKQRCLPRPLQHPLTKTTGQLNNQFLTENVARKLVLIPQNTTAVMETVWLWSGHLHCPFCRNHCTSKVLSGSIHMAEPGSRAHRLASRGTGRRTSFPFWILKGSKTQPSNHNDTLWQSSPIISAYELELGLTACETDRYAHVHTHTPQKKTKLKLYFYVTQIKCGGRESSGDMVALWSSTTQILSGWCVTMLACSLLAQDGCLHSRHHFCFPAREIKMTQRR